MRQKPMQKPKAPTGVVIVVELGAEWPSLQETRQSAASRRVLAQTEAESPGAFAVRVAGQLDEWLARGVPLGTAVVACNERLDVSASTARSDISRAALGAMARRHEGTLLLTASERSGGRSRQGLSTLATELCGEWQRAGVRAAVRFGDDAPGVAVAKPASKSKERSRQVA